MLLNNLGKCPAYNLRAPQGWRSDLLPATQSVDINEAYCHNKGNEGQGWALITWSGVIRVLLMLIRSGRDLHLSALSLEVWAQASQCNH